MEIRLPVSTIVATFFSVIVLAFLLQILNRKKANRGKTRKPPRAKGEWPIIGHLHLLGGSQLPQKVLGDMAEKYGPIFTIKLGVHHVLVVSGGDIAKECFTTNDMVFASRAKSEAAEIMGYNYGLLGLAPYGDYWRQVRKLFMVEVLSKRQVEMVGHIRVEEVRSSIKDVYEAWVKNKENGNLDMVEVEMNQWFGNTVLNLVVRIISGNRISPNDEKGVRFQVVLRKFMELMGTFVVSDYIPCFKYLDLGGYKNAMKEIALEMDTVVEGWLNMHKAARASVQQHEGNLAFMDVLTSTLQGASQEEFSGFHHDEIIKVLCMTILLAGVDTTSETLTWALSLLLNNPKALEIAQNEIDEHVGRDRFVEESDMKNLVYLNAIIKETLRLYPAAPLSIPHESTADCIVGGYNIPKGTRLLVNLWKIHRDPNIWSDPFDFRPERFMTTQKDIDVKGKHFDLLPFGSGRRMCPGVSFALKALHITLASLIQQFELKKPSNEPIDMTESFGITNSKEKPLQVLLAPRLSHQMYDVGE